MSIIEAQAVIKVEEVLLKTNRINPEIKKNDKTPIWDGEIYIYDKDSCGKRFGNDSLLGRIPVQVKGKSVKTFSNSIRVKKKYLDKFANENGAMYYVVQFCNGKFKIFYNDFLNHKVKAILRSMKKNSIELIFEELPSDEIKVYNIHKKFLENAKNQILQNNDILTLEDVLKTNSNPKFNFKLLMNNGYSLAGIKKSILEQKPYLNYVQNGLLFPLEQLGKEIRINLCGQKRIYFYFESDDILHYLDVIENEIGISKVIIDNVITIESDKLRYKFSSNLNDLISTLTIVEKILSNTRIKILDRSSYINVFSENKSSQSYQEICEGLDFYNKLLKLLNFLKIRKEIDLSLMTEKYAGNILWLYDCLILKKPCLLNLKEPFIKIVFCNITILLSTEAKNNNLYINDFFKNKEIKLRFDDCQDCVSNYFALITGYPNSNGLLCIDNLDYDDMAKEVMNGNKEDWYQYYLDYFMLALIDKYDFNKDLVNLELAEDICNYILECEENINTKLNYYQIKYRKNALSKEDKINIINLKNSSNVIQFKCGAALLLEHYEDFEFYFPKLEEEDQEMFKKFPIYKLYNERNKII